MLRRLAIKNYAIIDDVTVEFTPSFTVLTGATGAGKSIIIGALNLLLGEKASSEVVRSGETNAWVEGEFEIERSEPVTSLFSEAGIETDATLLIRREVADRGTSRALVNDRQVTVGFLKRLGDFLVDLHGQHQHQWLLAAERHLDFLDGFCGTLELREKMGELYNSYVTAHRKLRDLEKLQKESGEREELFRFQVTEIRKANLSIAEEETFLAEKKRLDHAQELVQSAERLYDSLYDSEGSATERLKLAVRELSRLGAIDADLAKQAESLEQAHIVTQDVASFLGQYRERVGFDPERYQQVVDRLDLYFRLKKKYGGSVDAVNALADDLEKQLHQRMNLGEEIKQTTAELARLRGECARVATALSTKRTEGAGALAKRVEKELEQLGMAKTKFQVQIVQTQADDGVAVNGKTWALSETGIDQVEFLIAPNVGETLKPLAKIASGGELSRIMLALKSVASRADQVDTLVFDEIDVGIGGEVAGAVGRKLKALAKTKQVLCITHLQQIAALADHHLLVSKEKEKNRMVTRIKPLSPKERVPEIARMLSGEKPTALTLEHAEEMLKTAVRLAHRPEQS